MAMTEVTAKRMNMTEIIKKAKTIGIDPGKMKKADLIRSIRTAEGSTNCFGTSDGQCAYAECCFMQGCFKISLAEHKQTAEHLKQQIGNRPARLGYGHASVSIISSYLISINLFSKSTYNPDGRIRNPLLYPPELRAL